MVAEGEAESFPRLGPTIKWDIAAADSVVRENSKMTYRHGVVDAALVYNKEDLLNPWFVVRSFHVFPFLDIFEAQR